MRLVPISHPVYSVENNELPALDEARMETEAHRRLLPGRTDCDLGYRLPRRSRRTVGALRSN